MKHAAAVVIGLLAFLYAGGPVFAYYYCEHDRYLCDTDWCIPRNQVCDGHTDCTDGSDEQCCGNGLCGSAVIGLVAVIVIFGGTALLCVGCVIACILCYCKRSNAGRHRRLTHATVNMCTSETGSHLAAVASAENTSIANPPSYIPLEPDQYQPANFVPLTNEHLPSKVEHY